MLSHADLLAEIRHRIAVGSTSNAKLSKLLKLPTSRISDILATDRKPRLIRLDEARVLVEHFGLNEGIEPIEPEPLRVDPGTIAPILGALLPVVDPDRLTDPVVRALSEAFAYGRELLETQNASQTSPDALAVAARAAVARFRELGSG